MYFLSLSTINLNIKEYSGNSGKADMVREVLISNRKCLHPRSTEALSLMKKWKWTFQKRLMEILRLLCGPNTEITYLLLGFWLNRKFHLHYLGWSFQLLDGRNQR